MANNIYQQRRAAGLCADCGKVPSLPGRVRCQACTDKISLRGSNRRKYYMETHKCSSCGKPLPDGWYYVDCAKCKAYDSEYTKQRRQRLEQEGKCPSCGKPVPANSYFKYCPDCRQGRHKYYMPKKTPTNAARFKRLFGMSAENLRALPEEQFNEWLNNVRG